ncbi:unnamed protein product [Leptidea sinapis]|uniref:ABC transmembrane type-1 domain-containing protein n=1 Tax=Leptidea sinapis TaxID=189913 RepID=A0A5E4QRI3_9NEOP|nr:unnamed protein product [Leptidea sinapis]
MEDADDTQSVEEHVPGLNLEFLRQLMSLAKIMVPGFRSHEVALLTAHTLCLFSRTFLSIYVASLEGSIALLMQWFGIAIPATFINSMIRYLESRLALAFRTRLVELDQLQSAYKELVGQMTSVFNKKLWYVMLEQFCMKYLWSGTGMVMLALPILTGKKLDGTVGEGISARTEYMTTSRNLLNSAADAIERLMSSYKEIVTLAGYATRVSDMLVVFGEVARGKCVRAVHVSSPSNGGFQVTFRDKQPVPQGKVTYTNDLSIRVRNMPIVTPSCDVVASGVTLDITPGTHMLIVGPNGCGKSRPVYALLDECTSAVSMETEVVMYEEAIKEGITLLSITHRPSVWRYHTHVLEFDGAGGWSFRPLEKDAPALMATPFTRQKENGETKSLESGNTSDALSERPE